MSWMNEQTRKALKERIMEKLQTITKHGAWANEGWRDAGGLKPDEMGCISELRIITDGNKKIALVKLEARDTARVSLSPLVGGNIDGKQGGESGASPGADPAE